HEPGARCSEKFLQLTVSLSVHWAMGRYCFGQYQPVLFRIMNDYVRHLAMVADLNTNVTEHRFIKVAPLFSGITTINQLSTRHEPRAKLFTYLFDQFAVRPGAKCHLLPS